MKRGWLIVAAGACFVGLILFFTLKSPAPERTAQSGAKTAADTPAGSPAAAGDAPPSARSPDAPSPVAVPPAPTAVNAGLPPTFAEPPAAGADRDQPIWPAPAARLESVRTIIGQYGSAFNGNPVGTNAEITAALNGDNPRQTHFLNGADGNAINSKGELSDPWGSPYFFHQLSAREMEIRSAGPDRMMYTADDLITR